MPRLEAEASEPVSLTASVALSEKPLEFVVQLVLVLAGIEAQFATAAVTDPF